MTRRSITYDRYLIPLLLSVVLLVGPLNDDAMANTAYIEDGQQRLENGDVKGAIIQFENAVRENPDDMNARLLLCESLIETENYARAEIMLNIVTKRAPSARASFRRAEAIFRRGAVKDAKQRLRLDAEILNSDPDWIPAVTAFKSLLAADQALNQGDAETAIASAQRIVNAEDVHFVNDARMIVARSWFRLGELRRAQIALDFVPKRASIKFLSKLLRGRIALNLGDARTAAKLGEELGAEFEGNPDVHSFVVETYIKLGEYAAAREEVKKIIPLSSTDRRSDFLEFLSYVAEGDLESASEISIGASAWLQSFQHGSILLAKVKFRTERFEDAERILRTHVLRYPRDFEARALLIRSALAREDFAYAQRVIDESLLINEDSVPVLFAKSEKLLLEKQYEAASKQATKALRIARRNSGDFGDIDENALTAELSKFALATVGVSEAMRLGRTKEAAQIAKSLIEEEPDNPLAHNLLAGVYVNLNELEKARTSLDKALELDPKLSAALINYATLETRQGNIDAFETKLGKAILNGAQDSALFVSLAEFLEGSGDLPGAIDVAKRGFALNPTSDDLGLMLARLNSENGNKAASLAIAERFAASGDINLAANGASIYLRLNERQKAIEVLKFLRSHGRGSNKADDVLIGLYRSEKRYADLLTLVEQMRIGQESDPDLLNLLVTTLIELGQTQDALNAASSATAFDPELGLVLKARVLVAKGDREKATTILTERIAEKPSGYIARQQYLLTRETNASETDIANAFATLLKWGDRNPEDIKTHRLIGFVYLEKGDAKKANDFLTAALAGAAEDAALLNNLAWARYQSGGAGAAAFAARAYLIEPENEDYIDSFGYLLAKEGERDRGIELLREAVVRSNQRPDIVAHLTEIEGLR